MKSKLLTALSVAALAFAVATPSTSLAKTYTSAQFKAELKKKIGKKKGTAAANAAASLFKSALSDKKNKKFADKYATSVASELKKLVKGSDQPKSVNKLVTNLLNGYFKGIAFNLNDARYNKALAKLTSILSGGNRTAAVSQTIYNTIKKFATSKGTSASAVYAYYLGVDSTLKLPPPPVS